MSFLFCEIVVRLRFICIVLNGSVNIEYVIQSQAVILLTRQKISNDASLTEVTTEVLLHNNDQ